MNLMSLPANFSEYQIQFGYSDRFNEGFDIFRRAIHQISLLNETFLVPELIFSIVQVSTQILTAITELSSAQEVSGYCKEVKNFTNFLKGIKSLDGLLNSPSLKVRNVFGMGLFILSSAVLLDRFKVIEISVLKSYLASIPRLGVLPYGGLLSLSFIGLSSALYCSYLQKKIKLHTRELYVKDEKFAFWSSGIDLNKIRMKQTKYQSKITYFQEEISNFQKLLDEGQQYRRSLDSEEVFKITVCEKACEELSKSLKNQKIHLAEYEKKHSNWILFEKYWSHIDPREIEEFCLAKENKWKCKLDKLHLQTNSNELSKTKTLMTLIKNCVLVGLAVAGNGLAIPIIFSVAFDTVKLGINIGNFYIKKSIPQKKIHSIDLSQYVSFPQTEENESNSIIEE